MGNIFWLAAYPKSGNTWLRAFIANLIANPTEPLAFDAWLQYATDEADPELFTKVSGRPSATLDIETLCALRTDVHARIAARSRGTVFVKTHNLTGSYAGYPLQNWTVTSGAVYVVRNPLDVAISIAAHFGISIDESIERLGSQDVATANDDLFVGQILGSWSQHVASWVDLESKSILVLRYEDMREKPMKAFGRVARLLGLNRDRSRIERAIRFSEFSQLQRMERTGGFREASGRGVAFFRAGASNQWRERLSRDQVERIISDHRTLMQRFRYLPTGY